MVIIAVLCGCQVITLNTLDIHSGQVSLTLDKTENGFVCWLTTEHILSIWPVLNFQMHIYMCRHVN